MASSKSKIFISLIFILCLIALGYYLIFVKFVLWGSALNPLSDRYRIEEIAEKRKIQYKMSYVYTGSLRQTISLNQGQVLFILFHEGPDNFLAEIKTNTDSLIKVLVNENGEYEGVVELNIPTTDAYFLDVKTKGKWGAAYK